MTTHPTPLEEERFTQDVLELVTSLVSIDSVNPSLDPTGGGEREIASYIKEWADQNGLDARVDDDGAGRPNVVVQSRTPREGRPTLLLCGHLDTVSLAGVADPLTPRVDGDRLYGRGTYDMKAGLAATLIACREARDLDLPAAVVVAAVADEEYASLGVQRLLENFRADAAIVCEPTEMKVGIAHRGFVWLDIEVEGVAAHGSRPELGVDAIAKMGPVLVALEELNETLKGAAHPLLGPGSVHASVIEGGVEASTIPERCVLTIERRTLPGETPERIRAEIESMLDVCRAADPELNVRSKVILHRPPTETARDEPLVAHLSGALREARGSDPDVAGMSYWADSAFISAAGIPAVIFGPSGEGAHADVEWVSISDTVACARALTATAASMSREV